MGLVKCYVLVTMTNAENLKEMNDLTTAPEEFTVSIHSKRLMSIKLREEI